MKSRIALVVITLAALAPLNVLGNGQLEIRVVDKDSGQPIAVRMHLKNAQGRIIKPPGVPALAVVGALLLAYRRRWADLTLWVVALCGGFFLNWWLKQVYDAVRPPVADPLRLAFEWGFPSGHAIAALIAYGVLGVLLWFHIARPDRKSVV